MVLLFIFHNIIYYFFYFIFRNFVVIQIILYCVILYFFFLFNYVLAWNCFITNYIIKKFIQNGNEFEPINIQTIFPLNIPYFAFDNNCNLKYEPNCIRTRECERHEKNICFCDDNKKILEPNCAVHQKYVSSQTSMFDVIAFFIISASLSLYFSVPLLSFRLPYFSFQIFREEQLLW